MSDSLVGRIVVDARTGIPTTIIKEHKNKVCVKVGKQKIWISKFGLFDQKGEKE